MKFKIHTSLPLAAIATASLALSAIPASAEVIFSESFESGVVSGFDDNTVPDSGWVGAGNGFGATNRGLYNETVAWPATPKFILPPELSFLVG